MKLTYPIALFVMLFGLAGLLNGLAQINPEYAFASLVVFLVGFVLTQKFV